MPELPEVETVVRGLWKQLSGLQIMAVEVDDLRSIRPQSIQDFVRDLSGARFQAVERRGKYIHFRLDSIQMVSHLRMTGKFIYLKKRPQNSAAYTRFFMELSNGGALLFQDMRRFGTNRLYRTGEVPREFSTLGADPFDRRLDGPCLHEKAQKRRVPIKQFLLDQRVIAGLGNIYVCEILFAAAMHPEKPVHTVSVDAWQRCVFVMRKILRLAIRNNGTTIRDFRAVDSRTGEFQNFLQVYGRDGEPCRNCGLSIERVVHAGRGSWFCPGCQKSEAWGPLSSQLR